MTAAVNWSCMSLLFIIFLMLYMKSITPQFQYCHFLSPTFYDFEGSHNAGKTFGVPLLRAVKPNVQIEKIVHSFVVEN